MIATISRGTPGRAASRPQVIVKSAFTLLLFIFIYAVVCCAQSYIENEDEQKNAGLRSASLRTFCILMADGIVYPNFSQW